MKCIQITQNDLISILKVLFFRFILQKKKIILYSKDMEFAIFLFFSLIFIAYSKTSLYCNTTPVIPVSAYQCMKNQGINVVQIYVTNGADGAPQTEIARVLNAKNAGLSVEVVVVPCRNNYVQQQAYNLNKTWGQYVNKIWLRPDNTISSDSQCAWEANAPGNCAYMKYLLVEIKKYTQNVGVYSDTAMWKTIFDNSRTCTQVSDVALWWLPKGNAYDQKPSFDSYNLDPIGGWSKPSMKNYLNGTSCGYSVNYNYYE